MYEPMEEDIAPPPPPDHPPPMDGPFLNDAPMGDDAPGAGLRMEVDERVMNAPLVDEPAGNSSVGHPSVGHPSVGHSSAGHSSAGHSSVGHSSAGHHRVQVAKRQVEHQHPNVHEAKSKRAAVHHRDEPVARFKRPSDHSIEALLGLRRPNVPAVDNGGQVMDNNGLVVDDYGQIWQLDNNEPAVGQNGQFAEGIEAPIEAAQAAAVVDDPGEGSSAGPARATRSRQLASIVSLPALVQKSKYSPIPGYKIKLADGTQLDPNLNIFLNKQQFTEYEWYYPKKGRDYPITKVIGWDAEYLKRVCLYGMSWEPLANCRGCLKEIGEFRLRCIDPSIPLKLPTYGELLNFASQKDNFSRNGVLAVLGQQTREGKELLLVVWSGTFSLDEQQLRAIRDVRINVPRRGNRETECDNLVRDFLHLQRDYVDEYQRSKVRREMNYRMKFVQVEETHADDWPITLADVTFDCTLDLAVLNRMHELPPLYPDDSVQWLFHLYTHNCFIRGKGLPGSLARAHPDESYTNVRVFFNKVNRVVLDKECVIATINQKKVVAIHRREDNKAVWFSAQYLISRSMFRRGYLPPLFYLIEVKHSKTPLPILYVKTFTNDALPFKELKAVDEAMVPIELHFPIDTNVVEDPAEGVTSFGTIINADEVKATTRKYQPL